MSTRRAPRIVIVGAGVMGLTLGRLLPGSVIYEKSPFVGGPSRTLQHNGFRFDVGLHVLGRLDPEVVEFLTTQVGNDFLRIWSLEEQWAFLRDGKIWPGISTAKSMAAQLNLPFRIAALLAYEFRRAFPRKGNTVQDSLVNHFGDLLYQRFWKRFSKKLYGLPDDEVVLPPFLTVRRKPLLIRVFQKLWRSIKPVPERPPEALYPLPWFGWIVERLAERCDVRCSAEIVKIEFLGKRPTGILLRDGERIPCEELILAVPPHKLIHLFESPPEVECRAEAIRYRDLIYVVLFFERERLTPFLGMSALGEELFTTAFEPKNWSSDLAPEGKTAVCFEVRSSEREAIWQGSDEEIIQRVFDDFHRYFEVPRSYEGLVYRIPQAWLVYDRDLWDRVTWVEEFLSGFENVHFPGKETVLKGNSFNESVREALRLASQLRIPEFGGLDADLALPPQQSASLK